MYDARARTRTLQTENVTWRSSSRLIPVAVARMQALHAPVSAAPRRSTARTARVVSTASARVDKCDKNSVIVSPSILSANFATLGAQARPSARLATHLSAHFTCRAEG
jgi:hypothetical protein